MRDQDDVLLTTCAVRDGSAELAHWGALLVRLELQNRFGVYAARVPTVGVGIYLHRYGQLAEQQEGRLLTIMRKLGRKNS